MTISICKMVISDIKNHNFYLMKYQYFKKWQNNPKVKVLLIVAVLIKLIIVVMVATL
jgi:hypothetical protein